MKKEYKSFRMDLWAKMPPSFWFETESGQRFYSKISHASMLRALALRERYKWYIADYGAIIIYRM